MTIKRFSADKIFGYLDFNFSVNSDLTFLIGPNGAGKTTALKLINALISPNFKDLMTIPFNKIALEVKNQHEILTITATSNKSNIILGIDSLSEVIELPKLIDDNHEIYSIRDNDTDELIDEINRKYSESAIVSTLANLPSPVFLGLDRRKEEHIDDRELYLNRQNWVHIKNRTRPSNKRRLIRGALGVSLMETELLVQEAYRRVRRLEERQSIRLRDSILLSAFKYTDFKLTKENMQRHFWSEKAGFLQRKNEITDALLKLKIHDDRLKDEVNTFFDKTTELFADLDNRADEEGVNLNLLINMAQIDKISKIVDVIDDYKSRSDELYKHINEFIKVVNEFYEDSNKILKIDTVGHLIIERPNKIRCSIEALSSGERQLLVIFAHAFFNKINSSGSVFIIDEPELSLHLRWQEKFAETILLVSPKSQFIMATHSPEIIGENKLKSVQCK